MLAARMGVICHADGRSASCIARQREPEKLDDWNPNIRNHFISRIEEWDDDAEAAGVFDGVNDFVHGDVTLGTMEDSAVDSFYKEIFWHEKYAVCTWYKVD